MYLSLLELNLRSRRVQLELSNRYELHRTLMHAIKPIQPQNERLLFRLEIKENCAEVIIQTQNLPSWNFLQEEEGFHQYLSDNLPYPQVKNFAPHFDVGQQFYFRLQANPTCRKAIYKDKNGHGKRIGLYKEEDQRHWLAEKGKHCGFSLQDTNLIAAKVIQGAQKKDKVEKHLLNILCIQYDGILQVTDPVIFEQTICSGIGPAKGFGCGLLSLSRF